ncbi:MAG: CinA family protein [Candidatus Omnitrophota bacterium]
MKAQLQLYNLLIKKKLTIATCESCTGGLLASLLTDISGSSKFFVMGIVAYSNKAKIEILKIKRSLINSKGAVSKDVAMAMAENIRNLAKTNLGVGITGVAGPTGAKTHKPVGLVYIAVSSPKGIICRKFNFKGNRQKIRREAKTAALNLIKECIR